MGASSAEDRGRPFFAPIAAGQLQMAGKGMRDAEFRRDAIGRSAAAVEAGGLAQQARIEALALDGCLIDDPVRFATTNIANTIAVDDVLYGSHDDLLQVMTVTKHVETKVEARNINR